jgi:hypothetical protein
MDDSDTQAGPQPGGPQPGTTWTTSQMAEALGIPRSSLRGRMRILGVQPIGIGPSINGGAPNLWDAHNAWARWQKHLAERSPYYPRGGRPRALNEKQVEQARALRDTGASYEAIAATLTGTGGASPSPMTVSRALRRLHEASEGLRVARGYSEPNAEREHGT